MITLIQHLYHDLLLWACVHVVVFVVQPLKYLGAVLPLQTRLTAMEGPLLVMLVGKQPCHNH